MTALQNNRPLPPKRFAKLAGALEGIVEVRLPYDSNTWRVYHLLEFDDVIYVLDAGMKKSHQGGAIPAADVRALEAHLKAARDDHSTNAAFYATRFAERKRNRDNALESFKSRRPQ